MKILVMPKPIEGVSREELLQHAPAEVRANAASPLPPSREFPRKPLGGVDLQKQSD